jgi:hypothetical protein
MHAAVVHGRLTDNQYRALTGNCQLVLTDSERVILIENCLLALTHDQHFIATDMVRLSC